MRTWAIVLLGSASIGFASIPHVAQASDHQSVQCPAPTVVHNGGCVLTADSVLDSTLQLTSFTQLDCQGHRLTPARLGSGRPPTLVSSQPQLALILDGASGVGITNCRIEGFDFGVLIAHNQPSHGRQRENRLRANRVTARFLGILGIATDNDRIDHNVIEVESGHGLDFSRADNRIRVQDNIISRTTSDPPFLHPLFPGSKRMVPFAAGVIYWPQRPLPLINLIIGGRLLQFPYTGAIGSQMVIERNRVSYTGGTFGILVTQDQQGTRVSRNSVLGGDAGIQEGGVGPQDTITATFPGTCSLDASRYAVTSDDCFIHGFDTVSKGIPMGVVTRELDDRSRNTVIEGNRVSAGSVAGGIVVARTVHSSVVSNFVSGASDGLFLAGNAVETAVITENVISGNQFALGIDPSTFPTSGPAGRFFGSSVFRNDFVGSTVVAIDVDSTYSLATELSVGGIGNYWGHSCAQGGFIPYGNSGADSPNPLVVDSHPFGAPIAQSEESTQPCR